MAELYNLGLKPSLLFPARLTIVLKDGARKGFSSPEEARVFAAAHQRQPTARPGVP